MLTSFTPISHCLGFVSYYIHWVIAIGMKLYKLFIKRPAKMNEVYTVH